jgi:hypothetical protein
VIESLLAGRAFIFQTFEGAVYHVSDTVSQIESWTSDKHITAYVDVDMGSFAPQSFLRCNPIQIVAASSPAGAEDGWLKQGDALWSVTRLAVDLWSASELFSTGFVQQLRI